VGGSRNGFKCRCRERACAVQAWAHLNNTAANLFKGNIHGYFRIIAFVPKAAAISAFSFSVGVSSIMSSKLHSAMLAICCLAVALPAVAQLDPPALRAKYGSPLNRETFHMPAGFDLVVDYGAANQVCKLQVPALMPTNERISNAAEMKKRMYEFLVDLVPDSMRGNELGRRTIMMGAVSISSVEYEHVIVSELQSANHPFDKNKITVSFKNCETAPLR
jgi:hypothetical protein